MIPKIDAVAGVFAPLLGEGVRAGEVDGGAAIVRAELERIAAPDLEVTMHGPDPAFRQTASGIDGFIRVWADWMGAFESYRVTVDDVIAREDLLAVLSRQLARPVGGSVEIATRAVAVWRFRDGLVSHVEFHLDRNTGLRAAGIDPASVATQSSQA